MAKVTRYENEDGSRLECYKSIAGNVVIICSAEDLPDACNMAYIFDDAEELQEFINDLIELKEQL